jgi:hypothetical protein
MGGKIMGYAALPSVIGNPTFDIWLENESKVGEKQFRLNRSDVHILQCSDALLFAELPPIPELLLSAYTGCNSPEMLYHVYIRLHDTRASTWIGGVRCQLN